MKKALMFVLFFLALIATPISATAQPALHTYHGPWTEWYTSTTIYGMIKTDDSGFLLLGTANGFGVIVKAGSDGSLHWSKLFSGGGYMRDTYFATAAQTHDGGYAVIGSAFVDSGLGGWDIVVVKLGADGTVVWQKVYGRTNPVDPDQHPVYEYGQKIYETQEGANYKLHATGLVSFSHTPGCPYHGYVSGQVLVLNSDGTLSDDFMVAGHATDSVYMAPDGGYLAAMITPFGNPYGQYSVSIQKYTSTGTMSWSKGYFAQLDTNSYDGLASAYMVPLSDGIMVATKTNAGRLFNFKTDTAGNPVRQTLLNIYDPSSAWVDVNQVTVDGGNIVSVNSAFTSNDDVLIKFGPTGLVEWARDYVSAGVGGPDIPALAVLPGAYAVATSAYDFALAFLDDTGNTAAACVQLPVASANLTVQSIIGTSVTSGMEASGCNTYISASAEKTVSLLADGSYHEVTTCPVVTPTTVAATPSPGEPTAVPTLSPQDQVQSILERVRQIVPIAKKTIPSPPSAHAAIGSSPSIKPQRKRFWLLEANFYCS